MKRSVIALLVFLLNLSAITGWADSPLAPLRTDNPRDTMRTFLNAMNDYKQGVRTGIEQLEKRVDDAVRCLDLSDITSMTKQQVGREAAILLKEVIDRIIVIDYEKIPEDIGPPEKAMKRWRLKDTEIIIARVKEGEREGEYLFSPETVRRAQEFYDRVKHLPFLENSGNGAGYREPWLQRHLPKWTVNRFLGLTYWQWVGLFLSLIIGFLVRSLICRLVRMGLRFTRKTRVKWDDRLLEALSAPLGLLAATGVWFASLYILKLQGIPLRILSVVIEILLFGAVTWLFYRLAEVLSELLHSRAERTADKLDDQLIKLVSQALKIMVVIFGVLLTAQNLGIDVFSLVAGLGIGGLAVALAAKDTLANFFGSITIMLDRPFQVGHWIRAGQVEGTVEDIGFRSTKIRTFYDSIISVPNSEIAMIELDNLGLRNYRRVYTTIGITYDTPAPKIEAFLEGIKNIIKANPITRKDAIWVIFSGFGASSLEIMVYFYVATDSWSDEILARQNIYLEIIRLANDMGVVFAFPTQTLHLESVAPASEPEPRPTLGQASLTETARSYGPGGDRSQPNGSGLFVSSHLES